MSLMHLSVFSTGTKICDDTLSQNNMTNHEGHEFEGQDAVVAVILR